MSLIDLSIPYEVDEIVGSFGMRRVFPYYLDNICIIQDADNFYLLKISKKKKEFYYTFSKGYWLNNSFYIKKLIFEGSIYSNHCKSFCEEWLFSVSENLVQEFDLNFPINTAIWLGANLEDSYIRVSNKESVH